MNGRLLLQTPNARHVEHPTQRVSFAKRETFHQVHAPIHFFDIIDRTKDNLAYVFIDEKQQAFFNLKFSLAFGVSHSLYSKVYLHIMIRSRCSCERFVKRPRRYTTWNSIHTKNVCTYLRTVRNGLALFTILFRFTVLCYTSATAPQSGACGGGSGGVR